jgi:hypothetical protein
VKDINPAQKNVEKTRKPAKISVLADRRLPPRGSEQTHLNSKKTDISDTAWTPARTDSAKTPQNDPDLAAVCDAWPSLPADVKQTILNLIGKDPDND